MKLWRKKPDRSVQCDPEQEVRLENAEKRANLLVERASWLHAVVLKRDQENHWQDSVDRLFLGGKP